jgi:hypothetical protein
MAKPLNSNLYRATVHACYDRGVPDDLTFAAARIIATDEAGKPDLGRSAEDQEIIKQVLPYLHSRENQQ